MKSVLKKIIPNRYHVALMRILLGQSDEKPRTKNEFSAQRHKFKNVLMCKVGYNEYGGYCVPGSSIHRPAAKKILNGDVYEPETIEYIIKNCSDGDIIHAGTFFGDFLPAISQYCSRDAKIWAFEPNIENFRCAEITNSINGIRNVVLTNAGLGERNEKLPLLTTDKHGRGLGGRSRLIEKDKALDTEQIEFVQIVTIDEIISTSRIITILQLDVEGFEQQALSGAIKTINRCLPIIILEVLSDSRLIESDWFSENILSLGYQESGSLHENKIFICTE